MGGPGEVVPAISRRGWLGSGHDNVRVVSNGARGPAVLYLVVFPLGRGFDAFLPIRDE